MSDAENWTTKAVGRCEQLIEKAPFFVMFGLDFGFIEFGRWFMETEKGGFDIGRARYYADHRRGLQREFLARLVTKQLLDDPLTEDAHDRLVLDAVEAGYDLGHNELMMHTGSMPIGGKFLERQLRERLVFLDVYRKAVTKALERLEAKRPAVDEPSEGQTPMSRNMVWVPTGQSMLMMRVRAEGEVVALSEHEARELIEALSSSLEHLNARRTDPSEETALEAARRRQDTPLSPDERRAIGIDETPAADWMPNPQVAFRPDRIPVLVAIMAELGYPKTAGALYEKLTEWLMTGPTGQVMERMTIEQARGHVLDLLSQWVKAKTTVERESRALMWVGLRECFRLAYGQLAWRETVLWAVETGELDAYIFDKDTLVHG